MYALIRPTAVHSSTALLQVGFTAITENDTWYCVNMYTMHNVSTTMVARVLRVRVTQFYSSSTSDQI